MTTILISNRGAGFRMDAISVSGRPAAFVRSGVGLLVLLFVALAGCGGAEVRDDLSVIDAPAQPRVVRFLAFGDAGTGSAMQIAVGQAMADVCQVRRCDFALELGDNIYDHGPDSATDPQFDTAFEIPYAPLTRMRVPIYVVLGNHDTSSVAVADPEGRNFPGDGANNARGNFEVEYGKRKDLATMWRMPARYYKFAAPPPGFAESPLAEFFGLDSPPLAPYRDDPDQQNWNPEAYAIAQTTWLRQTLKDSRARWKIVFAHHPYVSNGVHGNAGSYDEDLKKRDKSKDSKYASGKLWKKLLDDTVCAHGVELYLSGHDHDLEWLHPVGDCGPTEFILSGAGEGGAKRRTFGKADRNKARWQQDQMGGFFWIELTEAQMKVAAFTVAENGQMLRDSEQRPVPAFERAVEHP
jgi:tartrate-resistant acid phosphatase type 5